MVGTLEPRKGHADILAAFSELWRQGAENRLVLVGRMGWHIEDLRDAIRMHPEYGGKLLWFDDVAIWSWSAFIRPVGGDHRIPCRRFWIAADRGAGA